jgi:hypothetical protein
LPKSFAEIYKNMAPSSITKFDELENAGIARIQRDNNFLMKIRI